MENIALPPDCVRRWRSIGKAQGFTVDADIAEFLLKFFEDTSTDHHQPSAVCVQCRTTLICLRCSEIHSQSAQRTVQNSSVHGSSTEISSTISQHGRNLFDQPISLKRRKQENSCDDETMRFDDMYLKKRKRDSRLCDDGTISFDDTSTNVYGNLFDQPCSLKKRKQDSNCDDGTISFDINTNRNLYGGGSEGAIMETDAVDVTANVSSYSSVDASDSGAATYNLETNTHQCNEETDCVLQAQTEQACAQITTKRKRGRPRKSSQPSQSQSQPSQSQPSQSNGRPKPGRLPNYQASDPPVAKNENKKTIKTVKDGNSLLNPMGLAKNSNLAGITNAKSVAKRGKKKIIKTVKDSTSFASCIGLGKNMNSAGRTTAKNLDEMPRRVTTRKVEQKRIIKKEEEGIFEEKSNSDTEADIFYKDTDAETDTLADLEDDANEDETNEDQENEDKGKTEDENKTKTGCNKHPKVKKEKQKDVEWDLEHSIKNDSNTSAGEILERETTKKGKSNGYSCNVCSAAFTTYSKLYRHKRKDHGEEEVFLCNICGKHLSSKRTLDIHERIHYGIKPYACQTCSKTFRTSGNLQIHQRSHTKEAPYLCTTCGKTFTTKTTLTRHTLIHTGARPFKCKLCHKTYRQPSSLEDHMESCHSGSRKSYICQFCGRAFSHIKYHKKHIKKFHKDEETWKNSSFNKEYVCDICGAVYSQPSNLTIHKRLHESQKLAVCQHCGETFKSKYDVSIHQTTKRCGVSTQGNKHYRCAICGSEYLRSSGLTKHMARHEKGRLPACGVCGETFSNVTEMRRHKAKCARTKLNAQVAVSCAGLDVDVDECLNDDDVRGVVVSEVEKTCRDQVLSCASDVEILNHSDFYNHGDRGCVDVLPNAEKTCQNQLHSCSSDVDATTMGMSSAKKTCQDQIQTTASCSDNSMGVSSADRHSQSQFRSSDLDVFAGQNETGNKMDSSTTVSLHRHTASNGDDSVANANNYIGHAASRVDSGQNEIGNKIDSSTTVSLHRQTASNGDDTVATVNNYSGHTASRVDSGQNEIGNKMDSTSGAVLSSYGNSASCDDSVATANSYSGQVASKVDSGQNETENKMDSSTTVSLHRQTASNGDDSVATANNYSGHIASKAEASLVTANKDSIQGTASNRTLVVKQLLKARLLQ